jgi:hypothetical protein
LVKKEEVSFIFGRTYVGIDAVGYWILNGFAQVGRK